MPIVFTIFANPHGDLLLTQEQNGIQDALDPLVSAKKIEHLIRTSSSREDFFNLVRNRPKNTFAILHFGGHAHQHALQFQDTQVSFEEMAKALVDHSKESLQLVFLNGCSTYALVDTLFDLGVPAVIATSVPVSDTKAKDLAIRFYQHIALGDSIQSAYQSAVRYVNSPELDSARKIEETAQTRDILLESASTQTAEFPWGLYIKDGHQGKGLGVTRKKTYNEHLVRSLIDTIGDDCEPVRRFLGLVAGRSDWEMEPRIADKAKDILAYSFVGVVGVQIRKLMAIGKEDMSEGKPRKYIEQCAFIANVSLELLNFSLLSRLWDIQRTHEAPLPEVISKRVDTAFEYTLEEQFLLLAALFEVFQSNGYPLPVPELERIASELVPGSALHTHVAELGQWQAQLSGTQVEQVHCHQAEKHLTKIVAALRFLVDYRMVSIKHIGYQQIREVPPRFIHRYAVLGIDSKANVDAEKAKYSNTPTHTDSVILFRGEDYEQGINLSPFVIDYHALTFEHGTRIGFFCLADIHNNCLEYRMLDDNTRLLLEQQTPAQQQQDIEDILMDDKKKKILNLGNVVADFREAQRALSPGIPDFGDL